MPAYHSSFLEKADSRQIGNIAVLPIKTKVRGPAPAHLDAEAEDIVDEAISLFRANCFFRNFEIKGPADRTLIYGILLVSDYLSRINKTAPLNETLKSLNTHALSHFAIPGETNFPLNALYEKPSNASEAEELRAYLSQLRQEMAIRLPERIYVDGKPSKWWTCFGKRKFMNKSL